MVLMKLLDHHASDIEETFEYITALLVILMDAWKDFQNKEASRT
jgi:hypothetical protein